MNEKEENETLESKYIQQHLANERTYLAWVRTSIAIAGVGYLVTNLHFANSDHSGIDDFLALIVGIFSGLLGVLTILFATISYFQKKSQINQQTFKSSHQLILFISIILLLVIVIFIFYMYTI